MKTTVELPDELVIEAKKRAAELRQPLRALIEKGLRAELIASRRPQRSEGRIQLRWLTVEGGLPADLDLDDREAMHDWLSGER